MYCTQCGTPNQESARFCRNCGTPMAASAPTARSQPGAAPVAVPAEVRVESAVPPPPPDIVELLREAVEAEQDGDLDRALSLAEEAVRISPADARARSCLAGLYERAGRPDEAVAQYEASLALEPGNQLDRLRLARLAPDRAQVLTGPRGRRRLSWRVAAVVLAASVITLGGVLTIVLTRSAATSAKAKAREADERLVAQTNADALVSSARGAMLMGELSRAEALLQSALREDPANREAQSLLADVTNRLYSSAPAPGTSGMAEAAGLGSIVFPTTSGVGASGALLGVQDAAQVGISVASIVPPTLPTVEVPSTGGGIPPASSSPLTAASPPQASGPTAPPTTPAQPTATPDPRSMSATWSGGPSSDRGDLMTRLDGGLTNSAASSGPTMGYSRRPGDREDAMRPSFAPSFNNTDVGSVSFSPPSSAAGFSPAGQASTSEGSFRPAGSDVGASGTSFRPATGTGATGGAGPSIRVSAGSSGSGGAPTAVDTADRAQQLEYAAHEARRRGDHAEAVRLYDQALAAWDASGSPAREAHRETIASALRQLRGR